MLNLIREDHSPCFSSSVVESGTTRYLVTPLVTQSQKTTDARVQLAG